MVMIVSFLYCLDISTVLLFRIELRSMRSLMGFIILLPEPVFHPHGCINIYWVIVLSVYHINSITSRVRSNPCWTPVVNIHIKITLKFQKFHKQIEGQDWNYFRLQLTSTNFDKVHSGKILYFLYNDFENICIHWLKVEFFPLERKCTRPLDFQLNYEVKWKHIEFISQLKKLEFQPTPLLPLYENHIWLKKKKNQNKFISLFLCHKIKCIWAKMSWDVVYSCLVACLRRNFIACTAPFLRWNLYWMIMLKIYHIDMIAISVCSNFCRASSKTNEEEKINLCHQLSQM